VQALEVEFQNQQMYVDAQILEIVGEPHIVSAIVAAPSCFTYSRFLVNWKNAGIHV